MADRNDTKGGTKPAWSGRRGIKIAGNSPLWLLSDTAEQDEAEKSMPAPLPLIRRAKGALLYDYDGNRYVDLCLAGGELILGSSHPVVTSTVKSWISRGHAPFFPTAGHTLLSKTLSRVVLQKPTGPEPRAILYLDSPWQALQAVSLLLSAGGGSYSEPVHLTGSPARSKYLYPRQASQVMYTDPETPRMLINMVSGRMKAQANWVIIRPDGSSPGDAFRTSLSEFREKGGIVVSDELSFASHLHLKMQQNLLSLMDLRMLGSWTAAGLPFACIVLHRSAAEKAGISGRYEQLADLLNRAHPPIYKMKTSLAVLNHIGKMGGIRALEELYAQFSTSLDHGAVNVRDGVAYPGAWIQSKRKQLLERGVYPPADGDLPFNVSLAHSPEILEKTAGVIDSLF
jgi:hypothetical protein